MAQKRITQLLRSNTVYDTRALAETALVNEARNDGAIVLARYKSALSGGGTEVISIAGILAVTGDGQSTTILATKKDLDALDLALSGGIEGLLEDIADILNAMDTALTSKVGLGGTVTTVQIGGLNVPVRTYTYTPPANANYISGATNVINAVELLDTNLGTLAGNVITNITSSGNTVTVTGSGNTRNLEVNTTNLVDSNDKVLGVSNSKITSNVTLKKITTAASSAYAAQYQLVGKDGTTALGATIDIPRDLVIKRAYLADSNKVEILSTDTTSIAKYMVFEVYTDRTENPSATDNLYVDIGRFFEDLEASEVASKIEGDGLIYNTTTKRLDVNVGNGIEKASDRIQLKLDPTTNGHLTLSANGLKLTAFTGADILLTGFTESTETSAANLAPAATDTVNQALAKLYRTIELDEATTAAALTDLDSRILDLESASLTAGNGIDTTNNVISIDLDTNATGKGTSATTHNLYASNNWNALELSSDGLYLSSIWDCGTY